jgi:hypothetical protein
MPNVDSGRSESQDLHQPAPSQRNLVLTNLTLIPYCNSLVTRFFDPILDLLEFLAK